LKQIYKKHKTLKLFCRIRLIKRENRKKSNKRKYYTSKRNKDKMKKQKISRRELMN